MLQVINATINKGPANNTEACLQHEITRLTGEGRDSEETKLIEKPIEEFLEIYYTGKMEKLEKLIHV